ncbi:MAG: FGGY-family carbohydrate kinase [Gammaproteobacteria bacterium]|nr:FGGY-family carbohydrate kinase [Gammaproteobacteria bacterium]
MPNSELYIGIDLGTSGCRAIAIDAGKKIRGRNAVTLPAPLRQGNAVEQDPQLWWRVVRQVLRGLLASIASQQVRAMAVDGTSATLLATDAQGVPLGPALMYNDTRASGEAARIAATAPPDSGAHGTSSALAKLLWLQQQPGMARAAHALHQADWIAGKLSGRFGVSDENNGLKLGYDAVARAWPDWLDKLGVHRELLPQVVPPGTTLGAVTSEISREFGLPPDTRVVAGTTDSIAAFLATGAHQPGEAVTALGSTLALKIVSPRPVSAPAWGIYSHRLGDLWLAGGASNSGGAVLRQHFEQARLDAMTPLLQPDQSTGLDYYPLPAPGERFPLSDPNFMPRLTPRPDDDVLFFQGILESMARIEHQGYQRLAELGAPYPISVRTTGGGAVNKAWTQIRGRLLGVPMVEAAQQDAAYGAALLALRGTS